MTQNQKSGRELVNKARNHFQTRFNERYAAAGAKERRTLDFIMTRMNPRGRFAPKAKVKLLTCRDIALRF